MLKEVDKNETELNFTIAEVIEDRQHKYDEDLKCSCTDEYRGYMKGWFWAYQDIKEIFHQNGFDTSQLLIHRELKTRQGESKNK